ncbi:MAG: FMN-binding protein [Oscillospiraceae bacterium]|nr:FMN-binding protein [Oscillospiraceae bacterium]
MKKSIALMLALVLAAGLFSGCGGKKSANYADGTYTAQSSVLTAEDNEDDAGNGYGVVTITVKDNAIVDCKFDMYMEDGTLKDDTYGMKNGEIANEGFYKMAQAARNAGQSYAQMLKESGSLDGVDAISGATISYGQFVEAVEEALSQAEE